MIFFVKESMQNITILEQDVAKLMADANLTPAQAAKVAIHTLASNALAAEFKPMGELERALETWLNDVEIWMPQHTVLYSNTVKSLSTMWVKISELRNPRSARALIEVLKQATDQVRQNKALTVTPSEVSEAVEEITFTLPNALQAETPTVELLSEPSTPSVDLEPAAIVHPIETPADAVAEFSHDDYEVKLVT